VKGNIKNEAIGVEIHIFLDTTQANFLKAIFISSCFSCTFHSFSSTQLENRRAEQVLCDGWAVWRERWWGKE
jgi:hypothetical protein